MPAKQERVKVLIYLFFPAGGIGKYTHQLLEELVQYSDLDIEVVCLPEFQWRENNVYKTWPGLFSISHPVVLLRKLRFLLGQFINPWRLLRHAIAEDADIIHICNINYLSFPLWEKQLNRWGGKLVCSAHDIRRRESILNRTWEERQLKRFYRRCDALFVHSREQAKELEEFADVRPERIHVVPHGPQAFDAPPAISREQLKERYNIPPERQLALFFGYLRPDKNLEGFIQAMALARREDLHLLVAGNLAARERGYLEGCKMLAERLGLSGQISFDVRYIPDEEIPGLFTMCDWVALPYLPSFSSQSGVLNMAAFYERPVLITPSVSFKELLEDVDIGELAPGFDAEGIAKGIRSMMERAEAGHDFQYSRYRQHYSWASNAQITHGQYRKLVGDR